ncbi:Mediator of RNA polymerase II transcription subunit 18, partial [Mucuna pruriens]
MAMAVQNTTNPDQLQIVIHDVASNQFRSPSCDLVQNTRDYVNKCAPIYNLAIKGDWKEARNMLVADMRLARAAISQGWATLLHVAAEANQLHFVEELVKLLSEKDLELQDHKGNTAFCFAAAVGNVRIAEAMARRNTSLPTIRGGEGLTPLHMAALQGNTDMARYLYHDTVRIFDQGDWNLLFFLSINTDLALKMLQENPRLALARNENKETGLHVLARNPSAFTCQGTRYTNQLMLNSSRKNPTLALQLVRCLWDTLLSLDCTEIQMKKVISQPSQVIIIAAEVGNFEVLAELVRSYPDLIWEVDAKNRSIIHIAVLHRHAAIFNLIHEISSIRNFVATFEDADQNNLLHCAAKLAPPSQLNLVSGAAFQMMHELRWYEEVNKKMQPCFVEKRNSNGKTPRELFTEEHTELLTKAECWMKSMANSCMIVSTLIATEVFTAAFSIPRGTDDNNGNPNCNGVAFTIFAISDATALISSSISILIFLSMLTIARYGEDDFFKSLPLKLIYGLITLFISIASMMVAFSSAFFITYNHGLKWVPIMISVLALAPITLFTFLLFPLWSDIVYSAYFFRSIFRPSKHLRIADMECVVQGIIETQHVEALEILLQGLCGVQRERLRVHEICLKSGPHLGTVASEVRLLTVRHVGGAMRGAGAEQISVLVRTMVESKTSKNALRMFYTLGYKLDHELLRVGFSFNFHRGAQITVTVSSINKMLKLHATDEAVPVTPGIQMVEVTAPATAETYTEVASAVSSFCEYLAPLLHLSKPGISTGVVPTAAAAAASLMSDGGGTTL